jgi:hypothetical protein
LKRRAAPPDESASAALHVSAIAAPSNHPPTTSVAQCSSSITRYAPITVGAIDAIATAPGREMRRRRRSTYAVVNAKAVAPVVWPLG